LIQLKQKCDEKIATSRDIKVRYFIGFSFIRSYIFLLRMHFKRATELDLT